MNQPAQAEYFEIVGSVADAALHLVQDRCGGECGMMLLSFTHAMAAVLAAYPPDEAEHALSNVVIGLKQLSVTYRENGPLKLSDEEPT